MQKPAGMQASKKADPPKTHREFTSENFLGSRRRKSPPACPEERPDVRAYRESLRALELHRSG